MPDKTSIEDLDRIYKQISKVKKAQIETSNEVSRLMFMWDKFANKVIKNTHGRKNEQN